MSASSKSDAAVKELAGHAGAVQHVCVWKEGSILASTSDEDRTVRLWDLRAEEARAVRCIRFRSDPQAAEEDSFLSCTCFGRNQDELFIAYGSNIAKFDIRSCSDVVVDGLKLPTLFKAEDEINELSYNSGARQMDSGNPLLAAADDTGSINVVSPLDGSVYRKLDKEHSNVCAFLFHPFIPLNLLLFFFFDDDAQ